MPLSMPSTHAQLRFGHWSMPCHCQLDPASKSLLPPTKFNTKCCTKSAKAPSDRRNVIPIPELLSRCSLDRNVSSDEMSPCQDPFRSQVRLGQVRGQIGREVRGQAGPSQRSDWAKSEVRRPTLVRPQARSEVRSQISRHISGHISVNRSCHRSGHMLGHRCYTSYISPRK